MADIFAIEVCAYAIMHNHHHEVLHVDVELAQSWTWQEVIERWHSLYRGKPVSQRFLQGMPMGEAETEQVKKLAELWRERLTSISWFMRALNEPIARAANSEDDCTGKFFEARFKSQALLDEQALLACMAYVDLNPIRADIAETPEESDFTSIKQRIGAAGKGAIPKHLARFEGHATKCPKPHLIPFSLKDYIELVEWTGRSISLNKHGRIAQEIPPAFQRIKISPEEWTDLALNFEKHFTLWVGSDEHLQQVCGRIGMRHVHGSVHCRKVFV
ncbi:MAG: transposase [Granulosicoccaceae bacterium]